MGKAGGIILQTFGDDPFLGAGEGEAEGLIEGGHIHILHGYLGTGLLPLFEPRHGQRKDEQFLKAEPFSGLFESFKRGGTVDILQGKGTGAKPVGAAQMAINNLAGIAHAVERMAHGGADGRLGQAGGGGVDGQDARDGRLIVGVDHFQTHMSRHFSVKEVFPAHFQGLGGEAAIEKDDIKLSCLVGRRGLIDLHAGANFYATGRGNDGGDHGRRFMKKDLSDALGRSEV